MSVTNQRALAIEPLFMHALGGRFLKMNLQDELVHNGCCQLTLCL